MENTVTLSLKDYTDLILENNNLKNLVKKYQRKVEEDVEDKIYESRIAALNSIDEVNKLLDVDADSLLSKFTNNYSWTWDNISNDNYGIVDETTVKEMAVSKIKMLLNYRLQDLMTRLQDLIDS